MNRTNGSFGAMTIGEISSHLKLHTYHDGRNKNNVPTEQCLGTRAC